MQDKKKYTTFIVTTLTLCILGWYVYQQVFSIPGGFPVGKQFTVNENESLKSISERLAIEGYINTPTLFRTGISFFGKDKNIQLGGYIFNSPQSLFNIIEIFVRGQPKTPLLSVTIPEGSTLLEVSEIVAKAIPSISVNDFNKLVLDTNANGKLFPSTYFLLPSYTGSDILKVMLSAFTKKAENLILNSDIPQPLAGVEDVIILASLVEGEAKGENDMKLVSGVLLSRLSKGMPLQVDVDRETYRRKGLPASPINNPGLVAINAVLHPTVTDYIYYITGNDGQMYYAKTFEEHKKNIKKYLK